MLAAAFWDWGWGMPMRWLISVVTLVAIIAAGSYGLTIAYPPENIRWVRQDGGGGHWSNLKLVDDKWTEELRYNEKNQLIGRQYWQKEELHVISYDPETGNAITHEIK
jgi:hypothetical protein